MTNHDLVDWTLDQIAQHFTGTATPTDTPVLIDKDDSTVYEILPGLRPTGDAVVGSESSSAAGTTAVVGDATVGATLNDRAELKRSVNVDLATHGPIVEVSSGVDREDTAIGTEYDLKVIDGVSIRIEALHAEEWGDIESSEAFQLLVNEVRRAALENRTNPPTYRRQGLNFHSILPAFSGRPPENSNSDYFAYELDLEFHGFQDL